MNASPAAPAPPPVKSNWFMRWHRRILSFCLIIFAFELGMFLLVFPWLPTWEMNWVPLHSAGLATIWLSPYFRGLLSGLGLLNIYVAIAEAIKQLKSLFRPPEK